MKYYLSVVCGHVDPEYRLFADRDAAIAYTRQAFRDTVAHPDAIKEYGLAGGIRLLLLEYEPADDWAEVVEVEVSD